MNPSAQPAIADIAENIFCFLLRQWNGLTQSFCPKVQSKS